MKIQYFVTYTSSKNNHNYNVDCGYNVSVMEAVVYRHFKEGDKNINVIVAPKLEECDNKADDSDTTIIEVKHA